MVFVQKWPFFELFLLGNIALENILYDMLERKNRFLGYKSKKFKKWKNWQFYKGVNPWFWSKNCHFSNLLFWGNIVQENILYDILERKNAFLAFKNKMFKKSKNWHFLKGLTQGFGPKMAIFQTVFLGNIGQENILNDILARKNAFLGYKNKVFKNLNIWDFSMVLVQNWPFFQLFF